MKWVKAIIIMAVIAAVVVLGMKAIKHKKETQAKAPVAKVYPLVVKSMETKVSTAVLTLPYLALSVNEDDVTLSSRLSSRVQKIKKSGEHVKKGEVVVRLDTADLEAQIKSVKLSYANLSKTHQRTKALYKIKGASIEELQKEESAISSLKAQYETLKNQLSYATLKAPVDGVIAKVYTTEGSIAMPGKPLLQISAEDGFSLLVRLPKNLLPQGIVYDQKSVDLQPLGSTFHGLNEYKAFVDAKGLTTGESVDIDVIVYRGKGMLLPFDAILDRDGKSYVLLAEKDHALPQEVHIVAKGEQGVVVDNLKENRKIIVAKPDILLKLLGGMPIKIVDQEK